MNTGPKRRAKSWLRHRERPSSNTQAAILNRDRSGLSRAYDDGDCHATRAIPQVSRGRMEIIAVESRVAFVAYRQGRSTVENRHRTSDLQLRGR